MFFFVQINQFFERYKRLGDYQPTPAEQLADVDRFKQFGAKMTIKSLSERFCKTFAEVLAMQAEEVYEFLLMDFEENAYRRDLERAHKTLSGK